MKLIMSFGDCSKTFEHKVRFKVQGKPNIDIILNDIDSKKTYCEYRDKLHLWCQQNTPIYSDVFIGGHHDEWYRPMRRKNSQ